MADHRREMGRYVYWVMIYALLGTGLFMLSYGFALTFLR